MQATIRGRKADDLTTDLEGGTTVEARVTEDSSQLVVAEVDGLFVDRGGRARDAVPCVGPRTSCELDVVIQWYGT